jgi:hypothetical protein
LLLVLFAGASGCTSQVTGEVDGPIDYRVTGGFSGGGDGTALHVELDGTVTRHTDQQGTQTAMLDLATLDDLHQKILDARFATLDPAYLCDCADDYVYNVSVHVDGSVHTVMAHTLGSFPDRLRAVIDTLEDIHQRELGWR